MGGECFILIIIFIIIPFGRPPLLLTFPWLSCNYCSSGCSWSLAYNCALINLLKHTHFHNCTNQLLLLPPLLLLRSRGSKGLRDLRILQLGHLLHCRPGNRRLCLRWRCLEIVINWMMRITRRQGRMARHSNSVSSNWRTASYSQMNLQIVSTGCCKYVN